MVMIDRHFRWMVGSKQRVDEAKSSILETITTEIWGKLTGEFRNRRQRREKCLYRHRESSRVESSRNELVRFLVFELA